MTVNQTPAHDREFVRVTLARLGRAIAIFATGDAGARARLHAGALLMLLLGINALNVLSSYVARDFMTAIEHRKWQEFVSQAILYVGIFGLLTLTAVFYRFTEERLGLLWREWITRRIVSGYLADHLYYHLNAAGTVTNPDQRIADDVRTFTTMTLSLTLIICNSALTVFAFSGVLWSISRLLFVVAVLYAGIGSAVAVFLGRPLVRLHYDQADREANFRSDLIHIRENTESVALVHCEAQLRDRLLGRVDAFAGNLRRIIAVNRNLGLFTTGYNYLIQLIPVVIVAPLFIHGSAQFGEISQAAIAFANVLGAFSLIVTQFPMLSSYAAVLSRLSPVAGWTAVLEDKDTGGIVITEDRHRLAFDNLTLRASQSGRVLVSALTLDVPPGARLLITAPSALVTDALQKAIAGIWDAGEGRIVRPPLDDIALLPDRPYTPPGSLREFLGRTGGAGVEDANLWAALRTVRTAAVVERAGGLDSEHDWDDFLSVEEQRLLALARLLIASPRCAIVAHLGEGLEQEDAAHLLAALVERGTACVVLGDDVLRREDFDAAIAIDGDGAWTYSTIRRGT